MLRLRPTIFGVVRALTRGGDAGGGLDALRVDHARRRLRAAALLLSHQLPQQAVELGKDAVGLPLGEVAVDRVPVREVMRQVAPLHPGPVHVQDRVHDLAQVVLGRPAEVQGAAASFEAPGRQDRLDQLPAGIGQITRICATVGHDTEVSLVGGVRPGVCSAALKHGTDPGVLG